MTYCAVLRASPIYWICLRSYAPGTSHSRPSLRFFRDSLTQKGAAWELSEFVRVDNLADRRYVGSVIVGDTNGRYYGPAPSRI